MKLKIKGQGKVFTLDAKSESISIGRASDNDFVIPLDDFSRKHCVLTIKGGYVYIMDVGSKNGVTVDGKRIPSKQQIPVYAHSKVILANHFHFFLPNGNTEIMEAEEIDLSLESLDGIKRTW